MIYAGPIDAAVDYFAALGYRQPNTMDVADFLQSVATPDGAMMFVPEESPTGEHYSASSFADAFRSSERHRQIMAELASPSRCTWSGGTIEFAVAVDEENPGLRSDDAVPEEIKRPYMNPFWTSVNLLVKRNLTLLKRDKDFLIGKTIENFGMGIGMALIFLQSAQFPSRVNGSDKLADWIIAGCRSEITEEIAKGDFRHILMRSPLPSCLTHHFPFIPSPPPAYNRLLAGTYSCIFLTAFHILLGTLTGTPQEVDQRGIYYKHADARFFQPAAFLLGRQISQLPLLAMEIVAFGLPFYLISGLALEARAFFVYLGILIGKPA